MAKNRIIVEDIDEAAMLQSIYERDNGIVTSLSKLHQVQPLKSLIKQPEPELPEQPKDLQSQKEQPVEENLSKKARLEKYVSLFLCEIDLPPARFGKSVYIRKQYHDRISQIISVIGENEISLFGYLDNIIRHHFENFSDDIIQLFKKSVFYNQ